MFVRSLLAMSLSCIIANVALAASTTEQPLNPNKVSAPVEDPIDPLAVDAASTVKAQAQTQITAQEQNDLNRASTTLQNLQKAED
ncbi:murein L,D-transpeptidase, partial [Acinetobacter baumannii]|nr:murein L,D-transpeptidase [Acinetobacter baumannii]